VKDNYILCLSVSHNSSAALMKNGGIVVAVQEERFERVKNYYGYPKKSIDYCLKKANITGSDLSACAYTTTGTPGLEVKSKRTVNFNVEDWHDYYGDKYFSQKFNGDLNKVLEYKKYLRDHIKFNEAVEYFDFDYLKDDKYLINQELDVEHFRVEQARLLSQHLNINPLNVGFLDHHTCHAYYAYFGSPFRGEPCVILTVDGWGDGRNQTVWKVTNDTPELIAESASNDLGRIYKMATLLLAMKPGEHEFKVMGLAPYAKDEHVERAMSLIKEICTVEGMRIVSKNRPSNLYDYLVKGWRSSRFDNIAGAVQLYTEQILQQLVRNIVKETGISKIVISGGISMNIKVNKILSELKEVESLYVCASGGDESLSIGGCYYLQEKNCNEKNKPLSTMYLGFDVEDEISKLSVDKYRGDFDVTQGVSNLDVSRLLERGDIIGVVRGKAEFGARALGNRSIIANPSSPSTVRRINKAIKNRDFWMPFALSILEEASNEFILNPKKISSPFMTIGFDTVESNYSSIEAGTHPYDQSVRPQFVNKKASPEWHSLLTEFYKLTGIPALLNTSLNLHGEPIVNSIEDAIRTFSLSGLDHLLIQDVILLSKKAQAINGKIRLD